MEDTVAIAGANLAELAEEIHRTGRPKVLTDDGADALVLLAKADYEQMQEAIEVAAGLLRGDADVAAGRVYSNERAQELLRARIAAAATKANGRSE